MTATLQPDPHSLNILQVVKQGLRHDLEFAADIVRIGNEVLGETKRQTTLSNGGSPLCTGREADGYVGSRASTARLAKRGVLKAYKSGRFNLFLRDRCRRVREMILAGRVSPGLVVQDTDTEVVAELDVGDRDWLATQDGDLTLPDKLAPPKVEAT